MADPEVLRVSLKYSGPDVEDGSMSINDIVPALHGFANAYEKIASFENLSHDHHLRLVGLTKSSAEIHINVLEWIGTHATPLQVLGGFASGIVTTIIAVIKLKKHAEGKPTEITAAASASNKIEVQNHLRVSMEFDPRIYEVFRSQLIDGELSKIVSPLREKRINEVSLGSPEIDSGEIVLAEEKQFFDLEKKTVVTTREVWLEGFMDSLSKSRNRGTFYLRGGRSISYKLSAANPSALYVDFAYNGPVRVRCLAELDENLEPMQLEIYEIQRMQSSLFPTG
ncbi:MAG: hypothetical protein HY010_14580 [Acidobacteria bacterium]|nr:hypothetical protein [Acidobacteriota bacterium]